MPSVRVYLLTYRRNQLLPRALTGLLRQSFTNWVCELHNDAPDDPFPGELVARTSDPRITYVRHATNLGPVRTFNLVFQPCAEDYVCLLEDDNWWEPDFLAKTVALLEAHPTVDVAWTNMHIWQEQPGNAWTHTGQTIWPVADFKGPTLFAWPHARHLDSIVHSNGAALVRNRQLADLVTPGEMPFLAMETVRERAMRFPLLFLPEPLVNFSWTLSTHREGEEVPSAQMKALVTAAYLRHAPLDREGWRRLAERARNIPQNELPGLLLVAHVAGLGAKLARHVRWHEWPRIVASWLRHWPLSRAVLRSRLAYPAVDDYLDRHVRRRFAEAAPR